MTRRLPLLGGPSEPDVPAEPSPIEARLIPSSPVLAVVAAMPEATANAQAVHFVAAARAFGGPVRALLVRRSHLDEPAGPAPAADPAVSALLAAGAERVVLVKGRAETARQRLWAALDEAPAWEGGLWVSLGADVPAFVRPAFAVVIDQGASVVGWSQTARVVRGRFDAHLVEARQGIAERVVRALRA